MPRKPSGVLPKKRRESTKRKGRHPQKALTDAFCRNVSEAGLYADGDSLYLLVTPSGARRWIQRLMVRGRARKLGLGGFGTVSLAEARELARANRKLARDGGDPRAGGRHGTAGVPTFEEAAHKVLAIHKGAWRKGSKTASQWEGSLRDHAFPELASVTVDRVTTADMMAVLLPLWTSKYVTARKVLHRISAVMKWAMAQGYRTDNPAGDALLAALPRRPRPVRHRRALSHGDVGEALAKVRGAKTWEGIRLAFEFLVLTATRSAEVRLATWREVDLVSMVWTDPGGADEGEARAPDSAEQAGQSPQPHELVFTSVRGRRIDASVVSKMITRLGIDAVPHGFRSSFRDWASERTDHPREVVEAALAHTVRDQTEAAYARSDLFERRRHLMDDWADYLAAPRGQVVVTLRR